jgi:hypothetical protein
MRCAALVVGLSLLGCAPNDIVVATLPPHHDGGMERKCVDDDECHGDDFCARDSCDDVSGHCERRPNFCDATPSPVCGCDGVAYWSDCVRMQLGITAATPGECLVGGLACSGPGTCPHGASCARVFKTCSPDGTGACWQLPSACPPPAGPHFVRCGDSTTCVTACEAFRTEEPYQRLSGACPH